MWSHASVSRLLEVGVKIGLGTDGPSSNDNLDMFQAILIAPLLQKVFAQDPTVISA
jgi:5-methylthioadenosine/S-adenosylhomocysteine deaminase